MTQYVSPELTGTKLTGTYDRQFEGAITTMRQMKHKPPGWFIGVTGKSDIREEDTKPVMGGDTKALNDGKEVSEHIGFKGLLSIAEKLFESYPDEDKDPEEQEDKGVNGVLFNPNGTRYRRSKPHPSFIDGKYRTSNRQAYYPRPANVVLPRDASEPYLVETFPIWAGDKVFDIRLKPYTTTGRTLSQWRLVDEAAITGAALPAVLAVNDGVSLRKARIDAAGTPLADMVDAHAVYGEKLIWRDAVDRWSIADLAEPSNYRAIGECYDAGYPQKENPDSKIFRRKPRNSSPTKEKEQWRLNVWTEYRRLNGSLEPMQTNFGKSDGVFVDFPDDADSEGGEKAQLKHGLDSTMETRPNLTELERGWTKAKYETRVVRCKTGGPVFQGFNPCPDESFTLEIQIPISGRVECIGFRKDFVPTDYEDAARKAMVGYERHLKEHKAKYQYSYWPEAKRKTQKQIGIVANQQATAAAMERGLSGEREKELLNIREVDRSKPWYIRSIGGLRFAPPESRYYRGGQVVKYEDKNGIERGVKVDVPKRTRGPAYLGSADKKDKAEMKRNGWALLHPPSKTREWALSGEEYAEQLRNKAALHHAKENFLPEPEPCRDLFHKRVGYPNRPYAEHMIGRRHPFDNKPEPVERPGSEYAFDTSYRLPEEPADCVVERGSRLRAVNERLSPRGLIVANAIVWTELTKDLPKSDEALGTMLWSDRKQASRSKMILLANRAIDETENELSLIYQALSA